MSKTLPDKPVKVGDRIIDFFLTDPDGKTVSLEQLAQDRGVVIGFMHGTYCPHCIQQLNRANRYADVLEEHKTPLVWVLRDSVSNISAYRLASQPPPRFLMLPDSEPSIGRHFGIPQAGAGGEPLPSLLYLDASRTVRYLEAPENPHAPPNMDALLAAIETTSTPPGGKNDAPDAKGG